MMLEYEMLRWPETFLKMLCCRPADLLKGDCGAGSFLCVL